MTPVVYFSLGASGMIAVNSPSYRALQGQHRGSKGSVSITIGASTDVEATTTVVDNETN